MGNKAYRLRIVESDDEDNVPSTAILTRLSKLQLTDELWASDCESDGFTDSDEDQLSHTQTPPPDDTKRKSQNLFIKIVCTFLDQYLTYVIINYLIV